MLKELKQLKFNPNSLAIKRPDLLEYWDYEKNKVSPYTLTVFSRCKIYFKCKTCGQKWAFIFYVSRKKNRCLWCKYNGIKRKVQKLNIPSVKQYHKICKKYSWYEANPARVYKEYGWKDWFEFLNKKKRNILSYIELKKRVQKFNLPSARVYYKECKKYDWYVGNPDIMYKNDWENWYRFLGKEK